MEKKWENQGDAAPCFYHIILDGKVPQIPQEFLKHISKESSDKATLTVQGSARSWTVTLSETGIGVFLQDGWLKFLRDNSLGDSEFLLFTYDGNMCFSVQIFNKNGCERIVAASDQIRMNQEFVGFANGTGKDLPSQKSNKPKSMRKKKNLNCMIKSGFNVQASQTRENQDGRPKMKKPAM
ncbi:hypothetical protein CISIN_1g045031mg [Citrus sinensis]|uniref:TF-B3 domain-containing protein n=1 Tax=Citrus sinensis TaxID=2711 RepID=A0A067DLM8_CITSI|nr:hypothetical protein CISIN_1g045031mg [Citrus sinensis]